MSEVDDLRESALHIAQANLDRLEGRVTVADLRESKIWEEDLSVPPIPASLDKTTLVNGDTYAFRFEGKEFFAAVWLNPLTGHLELTQVVGPPERHGR